jgi:hypothetical protein
MTRTISGKELEDFLKIDHLDYRTLYPNRNERKRIQTNKKDRYCPCSDLGIEGDKCQGGLTVMDALKIDKRYNIPEGIIKVTSGNYNSGDVCVDDGEEIAYLYIGKLINNEDVALNLGGNTGKMGKIQVGLINKVFGDDIFFTRKVFSRII